MPYKSILSVLLLALLLSGCSVGQALKNNVQGTHYLQSRQYQHGEEVFRSAVAQDRDNPQPNYYLGRFLLADKKPKEALPYLKKAALLDPNDTDYVFWQGVAYGETGQVRLEQKSYQQVLKSNDKHLQALTYLGHNQLKAKEYASALATYEKVLKIWPYSPSALYNRALVARVLGRTPEEKVGWLSYLSAYPSGALAIKAVDHLNGMGEFSYRNHYLGLRTITLAKIGFEPFGSELTKEALPSLKVVGATASNMTKGKLQIVVYQQRDKKLAQQRALSVQAYLYEKFPILEERGVGVSWFDVAEPMEVKGKKIQNPESVSFFLTELPQKVRVEKKRKKLR